MGMHCKKAVYYMAKQDEKKLTSRERFLLSFHLLHCGMCRKFKYQVDRITDAVKTWAPYETLTAEEKTTLRNTLSRNL